MPSLARPVLAAACLAAVMPAAAEVRVVTDIPPVQSLVAMVAGDLPEVLLRPGTSPHDAALRPSDARALESADLVVWIGPDLTPGLEAPLASLAGDATVLTLFMADDADADEAAQDDQSDQGGDGAKDENVADATAHDDHNHAADAHAWLDPAAAAAWLPRIAEALAEADPDAAEDYRARAETAQAALFALTEQARAELADGGPTYIAAHDALGPFEDRFGLTPLTAIASGDATAPSAGRMIGLQIATAARPVDCILDDGGLNPGLVTAIFPNGQPPTISVDLLGATHAPGPDLYPQLIRGLLDALAACAMASE